MTVSFCLDTSIWIKYFCPDEQEEAATNLVVNALNNRLVSPYYVYALADVSA